MGAPAGRNIGDPLGVAALAKQVPVPEELQLEGGRLVRTGVDFEMNAYCRRAVSEGVTLARQTGGSCTIFTLGPPSAEDVLREAVAWGADDGLHLCDAAFAGSDTLATARALAAALRAEGPFDLVLLGRNTLDGETGQVGPEVAQLLDLPFAGGVRRLEDAGDCLRLELEHDDGFADVEIELPAVLSVAERLCEPCKVDPAGRAAVSPERLRRIGAGELGPGPWGDAGSPTVVGATRAMVHERAGLLLDGPLPEQVDAAVRVLRQRGALDDGTEGAPPPVDGRPARGLATDGQLASRGDAGPGTVAVLIEPGRPQLAAELLGAAVRLGRTHGAAVHALVPPDGSADPRTLAGADVVLTLSGSSVPEDVADGVIAYVLDTSPWALLAPSTAFGREVAGRAAAATGSGLVGDAIEVSARDGVLVAAKPAFSGALVADITCRSGTQMATVRPGVLPPLGATSRPSIFEDRPLGVRGRVRVLGERRNDDVETLARAKAVIGVGTAIMPDEYDGLSPLAAVLGAELAVTRKVTDKGWAPRARQVGITGRSISPRLYVAIGLSGKFNHMVGVRGAGTILAINGDAAAPVFGSCDLGIVGDWKEVVPLFVDSLRREAAGVSAAVGDAPLS